MKFTANSPKTLAKNDSRPAAKRSGRPRERNILLALGWYYPEMHRGVARFARNHNWHVTADLEEVVPRNWRGDGVITLLAARQNTWKLLEHLDVPIVDLAESQPNVALPRVTMDNPAIGRMAAEYFLNCGYEHFAFIHRWNLGVSQRRGEYFSEDRLRRRAILARCYLGRRLAARSPTLANSGMIGWSNSFARCRSR